MSAPRYDATDAAAMVAVLTDRLGQCIKTLYLADRDRDRDPQPWRERALALLAVMADPRMPAVARGRAEEAWTRHRPILVGSRQQAAD